jgi:hypothetical protein
MPVEAFPLAWPDGWKRAQTFERSKFKTGFGAARSFLNDELRRMGALGIVLSTNIPLRNDGQPRANMPEPKDAGVAVYFLWKGKQMSLACDKYWYTRDNIYSIAKTIEALRGIERWGASDMMERAFTGFAALPASTEGESWWSILDVAATASEEEIIAAHRRLVKVNHPDHGGSDEAIRKVNVARDQALSVVRSRG